MIEFFDEICDEYDQNFEPVEDSWAHVKDSCIETSFVDHTSTKDVLSAWEQQIQLSWSTSTSEFDEWKHNLETELSNYLQQVASDENVEKIGTVVDHYFSSPMFQHSDHEVVIEHGSDGGLQISVLMNYDDPEEFYDDFGVDEDQVDVFDLAALDGCDELMVGIGDSDLLEDAYWAMAQQHMAQEDEEFLKAFEETKAVAMSEKAEPDAEVKENPILSQSPEDILFEPITIGKKPNESVKDDYPYDGDGCYC